jgi:hypothetical protein
VQLTVAVQVLFPPDNAVLFTATVSLRVLGAGDGEGLGEGLGGVGLGEGGLGEGEGGVGEGLGGLGEGEGGVGVGEDGVGEGLDTAAAGQVPHVAWQRLPLTMAVFEQPGQLDQAHLTEPQRLLEG